ncbi:type II secretion system protein [Clostridium sp.]|uniref:type II secretion system protein n=1 Tax=Clostridium sp. TaxID=1506 RepID=UPI002840E9C7|nr:type II secretion system protein [Clostridium sp.]MDR3598288.1 type II secretion system protein [Clostridium sp.]
MKNNSKKCRGFTLIEVVICMAILAIISICIYDGLMIITKQIKSGQVKQAAALEGKKIIEAMQAANFSLPNSNNNYQINLGNNINFQEKQDGNGQIEEDAYGNIIYTRTSGNYVENVTLTPTKASNQTTGEGVGLDTNGTLNSQSNKLYISKINSQDYINYWLNPDEKQYKTPQVSDSSTILVPGISQSQIEMSVYFTVDTNGYQNIDIKAYTGQDLLSITKTDQADKDLVINFSNYINSDGSVPANDNIELDVYNKTTDVPNIYIEKSQQLNVDVEPRTGQINIYDNRSENPQEDNVGTLYDITLEIDDTTNNNNPLFTGYYKKNIH